MVHLRAREVRQLLHNKFVVIMGDSIQRAVYKDLVLLLQKDCLLSPHQLQAKGEPSFERDTLLERGRWGGGGARPRLPAPPGAPRARYREVRQFRTGHHLVRFYFLTRAYSAYARRLLDRLRRGPPTPDLLILNSCLGDLFRYGRHFRRRYPQDLESLFGHLQRTLPESCLLVWNTAMPVADTISGGFPPFVGFRCPPHLGEDVMEANFYSSTAAGRYGFDVLDLHFHFRRAAQHRQPDGVHWDEVAHRHLSQLLLAHVADAWGVVLHSPDPVGRWIADAPSDRHSDTRDRRQCQGRRGDPRPLPLPWHQPAAPPCRSPRRAEHPYRAQIPVQTYHRPHHRDPRLPSNTPRQARHRCPPAMCQPHPRDTTSMRQPDHRDAPARRHPHHRDAPSTSHPHHRDASSTHHPHHRDAPSTRHPHHRDAPSTRHPHHRDAPSMHQPHHRDASSTRQMDYPREASAMFFCESRLGPIRRISSESHGRRRAPPYPPRQPNESYACHPKWSGRRP
ncbi:PC-esterase domain-containing protein 1B-like [Dipodomys spectabilis]|uniref:PC-esterase domain-containing protein 1B-like n=1 Tax=Dipodomys spectabilis TaxID=105255 RepID=UPI001C536D7C|nr:PC-esterase domain-containing protein 1B-like [Dipodomys spectabilis]